MKDGDNNQVFPAEFQITSLMHCTFKCHLPRFSTGFPTAWLKKTRNITRLRHIVNSVQTKLHKLDDETANRSWNLSEKTRLQNDLGQGWLDTLHRFRRRSSFMS